MYTRNEIFFVFKNIIENYRFRIAKSNYEMRKNENIFSIMTYVR